MRAFKAAHFVTEVAIFTGRHILRRCTNGCCAPRHRRSIIPRAFAGAGMKREIGEFWLIGTLCLLGGCAATPTDTGYQPKRLNMTSSQIHGLYAPEFSVEAAEAKADKKADVPL